MLEDHAASIYARQAMDDTRYEVFCRLMGLTQGLNGVRRLRIPPLELRNKREKRTGYPNVDSDLEISKKKKENPIDLTPAPPPGLTPSRSVTPAPPPSDHGGRGDLHGTRGASGQLVKNPYSLELAGATNLEDLQLSLSSTALGGHFNYRRSHQLHAEGKDLTGEKPLRTFRAEIIDKAQRRREIFRVKRRRIDFKANNSHTDDSDDSIDHNLERHQPFGIRPRRRLRKDPDWVGPAQKRPSMYEYSSDGDDQTGDEPDDPVKNNPSVDQRAYNRKRRRLHIAKTRQTERVTTTGDRQYTEQNLPVLDMVRRTEWLDLTGIQAPWRDNNGTMEITKAGYLQVIAMKCMETKLGNALWADRFYEVSPLPPV